MTEVKFYPQTPVDDSLLAFAVIAAKYQGKWILCRHQKRDTWEIPGGHRESGERIEETARRELWEETGATHAKITPIGVYSVTKDGKTSYGMLFFGDVTKLEELPSETEIGEIQLCEVLPEALTYPDIQPSLHNVVQGWLNMQSSAGELWDVYDADRNLTGRTHRRGDFLAPGDYHLTVHIWIMDSKGRFLLTKRSPNKGFPNMWEATGGSALAGDDSLTAAIREVREETGLILRPENGKCVISYRREDHFTDIWLFRQDFDLQDVVLLEGETCDKMYATKDDILRLRSEGILVPFRYLDKLLEMIDEGKL